MRILKLIRLSCYLDLTPNSHYLLTRKCAAASGENQIFEVKVNLLSLSYFDFQIQNALQTSELKPPSVLHRQWPSKPQCTHHHVSSLEIRSYWRKNKGWGCIVGRGKKFSSSTFMKMMHFDCSRINRIFFRQVMPSSFLSQESISLSKNYNWYVFDQGRVVQSWVKIT